MKIGVIQLNSVNCIEKNFFEIQKILSEIQNLDSILRPRLLIFPENSLFFKINRSEKIQSISILDEKFKILEKWCSQLNIFIHLTTSIDDKAECWNASVLISPGLKSKIIYKKIHLFDIELSGQEPIRESDYFGYGDAPSVFEIDNIRFGSSICYDVRFSELYVYYAKAEVDIILIPAAFLVQTGKDHWEILLRARAIESQAFVLAAAQVGSHKSINSEHIRETYGHSLAVGPWGKIISINTDKVGLMLIDINPDECSQIRGQIPMRNHRRL